MENTVTISIVNTTNMVRNVGRFSDVKGFNPDLKSFIVLRFKLRYKYRYKL